MKTLFFNARLVDANIDTVGSLVIEDGYIVDVVLGDSLPSLHDESIEKIDVENKVIMPSFIDIHTHLRNPGQETKETIESFLQASVAGGYGTLVAMPNTNPVMSDECLARRIQVACSEYNMADVIQSLSLTKGFDGTDVSHLDSLQGFPLVTEDGKDVASSAVMLEAMKKCAKNDIVVSCHSEDASLTEPAKLLRNEAVNMLKDFPAKDWASLDSSSVDVKKIDELFENANDYLALAEDIATERNIAIAEKARCKVHIAHASTKKTLDCIRRWKKESKVSLTCEIAPHHFALSSDDVGFLRYIVNPPIRNTVDKDALIAAIVDGTCDAIATDHAPHTMSDKDSGAPGFAGLETAFAVSYTELVNTKKITLSKLSSLMSKNPANILGITDRGAIQKGMSADLVMIDTECAWTVDSSAFKTHGKVCPFEGKPVKGRVLQTWYKGKKVFEV